MGYSSDVTDREWEIIESLLPQKKKTRPPVWTRRQILNAILYQLKNGCNWADLPRDLPPYSTVFWHYQQWCKEGILDKMDNGYHPEKLTTALEQIYPQIMSKIQFELSAKPSKADKADAIALRSPQRALHQAEANGQSGFVPVKARWVIERSNAWVERCKRLVKKL